MKVHHALHWKADETSIYAPEGQLEEETLEGYEKGRAIECERASFE